jgi:hypothetical protein
VVLVAAIVAGATLLLGGDPGGNPRAGEPASGGTGSGGSKGGSGGGPDGAVKLVTPKTLDGGAYVLEKDTEALKEEGTNVQGSMPQGVTSVLARYQLAADSSGRSVLVFSGGYGSIGSPEQVQDGMFQGFEQSSSATVETERQEFRPDGADGPAFDCEVVRMGPSAGSVYVPVCTWAEKTDAAMVMDVRASRTTLSSVDLEAFAEVAAGIHEDTREPAQP